MKMFEVAVGANQEEPAPGLMASACSTMMGRTWPDAVFVHDDEGAIVEVNPKACASVGYTRDELLGLSIDDIIEGFDFPRPQSASMGTHTLDAVASEICIGLNRRKDGSTFPVELHFYALACRDKPYGVAVVRDISERRRVEAVLRCSEERFRKIYEHASIGVAIAHWDGHFKQCNPAYCGLVGFTESELQHMHFSVLIHPDDLEHNRRGIAELMAGRLRHLEIESRYLHRDGREVWAHKFISLLPDASDSQPQLLALVTDITERKALERKAQEHQQKMEALLKQQVVYQTAASIAHELNQPLVAISHYNQAAMRMLRSDKAQPDKLERALSSSYEQAQRAGDVLKHLITELNYLRGEHTRRIPFALGELIEQAIATLRRRVYAAVRIEVDVDPDLPLVTGLRLQTEKVLLNLLANGIEAMGSAGVADPLLQVSACALADGGFAMVTVRDHGPGLDAEAAERAFDPFYTTKEDGIGLGLAISRALIEAQGGRLCLDPDCGPGAAFHFTLPFAEE